MIRPSIFSCSGQLFYYLHSLFTIFQHKKDNNVEVSLCEYQRRNNRLEAVKIYSTYASCVHSSLLPHLNFDIYQPDTVILYVNTTANSSGALKYKAEKKVSKTNWK